MSETTRYTPDNDAVNWKDVADQLFPAEALQAAPVVNSLALVRNNI